MRFVQKRYILHRTVRPPILKEHQKCAFRYGKRFLLQLWFRVISCGKTCSFHWIFNLEKKEKVVGKQIWWMKWLGEKQINHEQELYRVSWCILVVIYERIHVFFHHNDRVIRIVTFLIKRLIELGVFFSILLIWILPLGWLVLGLETITIYLPRCRQPF